MSKETIVEGIIIGGVGGAIAGLIIWLADLIKKGIMNKCHTIKVKKWLKNNTTPNQAKEWRSTRAIASHNDLTEDRVRFVCSNSSNIQLNTKEGNESKELWKLR
ncbi:hypothetical protein [Draconibacterium mangrovi]|uniref:hypothetical protein n=1 Tax=Draconibacterium mangrovi TaxID=2697469 RepID=UPI0013CFF5EE|nr:hypothetical protein [Draconibacterium mangrovi]